jgi:hypothetical protein
VPTICEFNGIVISMYRREHGPPHSHANFGEYQAVIAIDPIRVLRGRLPGRVRRLVLEWATLHRVELADNWRRAQQREEFVSIAPSR